MANRKTHPVERVEYNGKHYTIPILSAEDPIIIEPHAADNTALIPQYSPVIQTLNSVWNLQNFKVTRTPISLGVLPLAEQKLMAAMHGVPLILDMPIKFPGSNVRLPRIFQQFAPIVQRAFNYEAAINPRCFDELYCYLTVDQGIVPKGVLLREASCHVDGFQGARWHPRRRGNHTYTVANVSPTAYYIQPFDFDQLDEDRHNFFFEMNYQVAQTNSAYVLYPELYELTLMDCYCVHRGTPVPRTAFRTFVRLSFEERIFDRLGNAHNPLFSYDWEMVPRDIEQLYLQPFRPDCDPSLRVFPWQNLDGTRRKDKKQRTQPNLRPGRQATRLAA